MNPNTAENQVHFSNEVFAGIMTGGSDDPAVKLYFDQEYSNEGGNQRAQRERDRNDPSVEPWPATMIPRYYANGNYRQAKGIKEDSLPVYTIDGDVVISDKELQRGMRVWRCRFTGTVNLVNLRSKHDIIFDQCIFEKGLTFGHLNLRKLHIEGTLAGAVQLTIHNSVFDELLFVDNKILIPEILNTSAKIINIKN